ncbi:NADH dehydrogenase FAD-containing subunit [Paraburkholderia sp. BL6669N2]|uniref:NAD(P)/FAD-dependent oxidoreductase n=1 Tax=Paraburkholderia sp. BL6669N2 TaxID=1938807 RepID=UPI000E2512A3|nr:NAD(P)/FAD-dependent oxidoreductase [Paraburkholderia sp. BL6669N2]REG52120.1 NADH dehydrogenase FAD-containing subunit [Paraburkholderia sp. BL6669N2]
MSHRIVVVGGGAGGLELATRLGRKLGRSGQAEITLVDAQMTHVWKPLLHEVAAGSLSVPDNELNFLAQAKWNHFNFQLGRLCGIDRSQREIRLTPLVDEDGAEIVGERMLGYDTLVIAVGSNTNDFGTPGAAEHCVFLDTTQQAERFHRQLLQHYMTAHALRDSDSQVSIAIVGAGATGVELAAELRHTGMQLANYGLDGIQSANMHITLVEAGPRVLPALSERASDSVTEGLRKIRVEVRTATKVKQVRADALLTDGGELIPASLKVWAAGIRAPAFLRDMDGLETNRLNQLMVSTTLQTTTDENIFAFGDCAACPRGDGTDALVPPRAQAAHQQAALLAKSLVARLSGKAPLPYRYQDFGSLVSLSRFDAVGELMGNLLGDVSLSGWLARMFYVSLYRMHQVALYGSPRALLRIAGDCISRRTSPRLKLH